MSVQSGFLLRFIKFYLRAKNQIFLQVIWKQDTFMIILNTFSLKENLICIVFKN